MSTQGEQHYELKASSLVNRDKISSILREVASERDIDLIVQEQGTYGLRIALRTEDQYSELMAEFDRRARQMQIASEAAYRERLFVRASRLGATPSNPVPEQE